MQSGTPLNPQPDPEKPRVALVVTSTLVVRWFLLEHIRTLARSFALTLIVNNDAPELATLLPCRIVSLRLERDIAPLADLCALASLWRHFRAERYQLVHTLTPKAGLLGMLAARLARVPLRLHTFQGEVWVTRRGAMRWLLKNFDRLLARLATDLLVVSASEREFLIAAGLIPAAKSRVLKHGSIAGVDCGRFKPGSGVRAALRAQLGIAADVTVFLFIGRLKRDKGVLDLARAFSILAREDAACHLLIVGPDEDGLLNEIRKACGACLDRLHVAGLSAVPERYMGASDVLCLPSYREGFPVTILEAAAAGLPAIGSRIYGITDAIVEGETGLLFEAGNVRQLAQGMRTLAGDPGLRQRMGERARERVLRDFAQEQLTAALLAHYRGLLARQGP
ncbi:MAG: glycosyltransferase family 4 protein [Burkholderiales bacterium]|nr:glycosyltransferase family 4 protein [Burkholderiales bacterium]